MKERDNLIDLLKGVGIILVVIGHAKSPFVNIINQFHMPLFFFISGLLWKEHYINSPTKLVYRRIKSLYLPYVFYNLIFLIFHNFFIKIYFYSVERYETNIIYTFNYKFIDYINEFLKIITLGASDVLCGSTWFLASLLEVTIIFLIINIINSKIFDSNQISLLLMCFFSFFVGISSDLPRLINTSLVGVIFVYWGYSFRKINYKFKVKLNFIKLGMYPMGMLLLCLISRNSNVSMVSNSYTSIVGFLISSIIGIIFSLEFCKILKQFYISKYISYIGQNTIVIMSLHLLVFKLFSLIIIILYKMPIFKLALFPVLLEGGMWWIGYSIFGIFIPLVIKNIVLILKKSVLDK